MNKPRTLNFLKTLRLAMILVCLFVMSCSKEEDPEGAAGETDTTTSPSTTPGSTGSGNDGTGVGVIAPDIRRGINTQQFFIDKVVGNQNNLFYIYNPFKFSSKISKILFDALPSQRGGIAD